MIRKRTLLTVDSNTQQICCQLTETNCNCQCTSCSGCVDCVDCPNLTIADVTLNIYRSGNVDNNKNPLTVLIYPAFTLVDKKVCFFIDSQLLALSSGRYTGLVKVKGNNAGSLDLQVGISFNVCSPSTIPIVDFGNDMQP